MKTRKLSPDPSGIADAVTVLREGGLLALPTETVYGLAADARDGAAVAKVYEAKGRPAFNPLIVHLAEPGLAQEYVQWNDMAERLAAAFWPGPLTLVLPLRHDAGLSSLVTAGLSTVAIRVPAHRAARAVLDGFGGPVAAPSANPSGRITSTTAEHVLTGLDGRIDAVLDAGPCPVGLESTIIGLNCGTPVLLREGGLAAEDIADVAGMPVPAQAPGGITAPGQLSSHYAPAARVRLNATERQAGEVVLGFGALVGDMNLSPSGDLIEAAAHLFGHLHALDAMGHPIAVAPIPNEGLGRAINDRLRRAAAPR